MFMVRLIPLMTLDVDNLLSQNKYSLFSILTRDKAFHFIRNYIHSLVYVSDKNVKVKNKRDLV